MATPRRQVRAARDDWVARQAWIGADLMEWAFLSQRTSNDREYVSLNLAHSRLQSVIYAAEGIRYTVNRIRTLERRMKGPGTDKLVLSRKQVVSLSAAEFKQQARAAAKTHEMSIEFHTLVWWTRSLLDRLDEDAIYRDPKTVQSLIARGAPKDLVLYTGLMRFIPNAEAARFKPVYVKFCSRWEQDIRNLADFSLHYSAATGNLTRFRIARDGLKVVMADHVPYRLSMFGELPMTQERDVASFTAKLWPDVRRLINSILDTFEAEQKRRLQQVFDQHAQAERHHARRATRPHLSSRLR